MMFSVLWFPLGLFFLGVDLMCVSCFASVVPDSVAPPVGVSRAVLLGFWSARAARLSVALSASSPGCRRRSFLRSALFVASARVAALSRPPRFSGRPVPPPVLAQGLLF